ncbi:MAG: tetratricopeptide repeat protein, partial [Verrucomicrobia bacterium]|nr:tetratricopeptide repeat protein [Verrucomicrobiota bacterium]
SHELDWSLFGDNPGAFHVENLVIHIANTLLLFLVLRAMTKSLWRSAVVAALFAWHPAHIQSVAWISERKDMLSGFFMLLTLWAYARHAEKLATAHSKSDTGFRTTNACWLAFGFFGLGLLSKPMLVTLPAILMALDFWPLGRVTGDKWRVAKALIVEKIPFVLLSLGSIAATLIAQSAGRSIITAEALPWPVRLANVPVHYVNYLEKLFWPENLAIFYPYKAIPFWEQALCFLGVGALTIVCIKWNRSRPWYLAGWVWFLVTLLPVIGLVQAGSQSIADRYTYLPSIGIFIAVAWGAGEIAIRSRRRQTIMALAAIVVLPACALNTRWQLRYWRDTISLARHSLEVSKENNFSCYFGLGDALIKAGDLDGAIDSFQAGLQAAYSYPWQVDTFPIHRNLGCVLLMQDRAAEAGVQFQAALKMKPDDALSYKYLGDALIEQGKPDDAEQKYTCALGLMPDNPALLHQIETSKTLVTLLAEVKTNSTADIHGRIGAILASKGKFSRAVEQYAVALELAPDSAGILNNLAWLLATCPQEKIRNGQLAVKYARHACDLAQSGNTTLLGTLAAAYAEAGMFDDAIATAQKACDLAAQNGEIQLLQNNRQLLKLYRKHKPARSE